jgi:DNA polymerase
MDDRTIPDTALSAESLAAALAWWREAGVDHAYVDTAKGWLAPAQPQPGQGRPPAATPVATEPPPPPRVAIPDDLAAFRNWWLTAPELDAGRVAGRVAPRGEPGAALMIVAPAPEEEDRDILLSGPQGRLLDAFRTAAGLADAQVYRASVLPCHMAGADRSPRALEILRDALLRHVLLVRPERVLVLGMNILPLLGNDSPHRAAISTDFSHEDVTIPVLAVRNFPAAASLPRWKSALWRAWLDWTA